MPYWFEFLETHPYYKWIFALALLHALIWCLLWYEQKGKYILRHWRQKRKYISDVKRRFKRSFPIPKDRALEIKAYALDRILEHLNKAKNDPRKREQRRARIALGKINGWLNEGRKKCDLNKD